MKKIIFGIFAHPDDEAFGPCGTLLTETRAGAELHMFTLTSGEAGQNPDGAPDLGAVRDAEWRTAAKLIGATSMLNLRMRDGRLNNATMQLASSRILQIVRDTVTSHSTPVEAEIITFEPNGLTGHIDHIVATRVASYVFYRLKDEGLPMARIRYYCHSEETAPRHQTDWIFADKGHSSHEIDETIDARHLREDIIQVMSAHHSQRGDRERYLARYGDQVGLDHFIVKT